MRGKARSALQQWAYGPAHRTSGGTSAVSQDSLPVLLMPLTAYLFLHHLHLNSVMITPRKNIIQKTRRKTYSHLKKQLFYRKISTYHTLCTQHPLPCLNILGCFQLQVIKTTPSQTGVSHEKSYPTQLEDQRQDEIHAQDRASSSMPESKSRFLPSFSSDNFWVTFMSRLSPSWSQDGCRW